VVHGEFSEVECASTEPEKVVPLGELAVVGVRVAVDDFDIRGHNAHLSELTVDMGWREQGFGVEDDVVTEDLDAGDITRLNQVSKLDMEVTEEAFQWNLQHVEFCDVELHTTVGGGGERASELNGKGKDFMNGAVQLELVAFRLDRDVLERCVGWKACVEIVADVSDIGVDDAFLDFKDEGVRVIEGRIDLLAGAEHFPANPPDIDAEGGAFAQEQIVRIDLGGSMIIGGGASYRWRAGKCSGRG
jgi:hypothetical protein